jgi:tetratricopeptide (TPR) repeat protein
MADDRPQEPDAGRVEVESVQGTAAFGGDVHQQAKYLAGHTMNVTVQEAQPMPPPAARLQLPPDVGDFTGRTSELAELQELLGQARDRNRTATPVLLVNGMPGVGKSALALHLAHLVQHDYSDAWLYVRLSGVGEPTVTAADALDRLLRALGVAPEQLPAEFEERVDLYRTLLAGQRALVLLDNALDRAQVEPLRPAGAGSLVLVTSRSDLPGMDGVSAYRLQPMVAGEGVELLARLVGSDRVAVDQGAAERVVAMCGGLPLAIRLAGASLATTATRSLPLGRLVDRLADARGRLDALADEADERRAVRASFQLSYGQLPGELARAFRSLSLLQVPDVTAEVVAALVDVELEKAQGWLGALVNAQLVEPVGPTGERYRLHDLLALYAAELAEQDPAEQRQAAVTRVLVWYLEQAKGMNGLLNIGNADLEQLAQGDSELAEQARADPAGLQTRLMQGASGWFEAERASLVAVQRQAAELGEHEAVWRLASGLAMFFNRRKHWGDWQATHERALQASRKTGDRKAEGLTLGNLGIVYREQRRFVEAISCFEQDIAICRELRDRLGEAQALGNLGNVYYQQRRFAEAIDSYQQNLAICRELGDRQIEGKTLSNLGNVFQGQRRFAEAIDSFQKCLLIYQEVGDRYGEGTALGNLGNVYADQRRFGEAIDSFQKCLLICQELGDRYGEGMALGNLGTVYADQGRSGEATDSYQESLAIRRELGDRYGEGQTLSKLGNIYRELGDRDRAEQCLTRALAIFQELQAPEAEQAAAALAELHRPRGLRSLLAGWRRR